MQKQDIISEWFRLYSNDIYNFLVYYRGSQDVYDLVQETFIKATRGLHNFRKQSKPKTWLISIARNVAIDHSRKEKRRPHTSPLTFSDREKYVTDHNPEDRLLENEAVEEIYGHIMSLRHNYRDVLILRGIQGMSIKESAEILNWTESKVKQTFYRARKVLEKRLMKKGVLHYES